MITDGVTSSTGAQAAGYGMIAALVVAFAGMACIAARLPRRRWLWASMTAGGLLAACVLAVPAVIAPNDAKAKAGQSLAEDAAAHGFTPLVTPVLGWTFDASKDGLIHTCAYIEDQGTTGTDQHKVRLYCDDQEVAP